MAAYLEEKRRERRERGKEGKGKGGRKCEGKKKIKIRGREGRETKKNDSPKGSRKRAINFVCDCWGSEPFPSFFFVFF